MVAPAVTPLAPRVPPAELPLPPGWRAEPGEDGAPVYRHASGVTTVRRCASPRCRAPFVPRDHKQRTCGQRPCQWVVREQDPTRKESKTARFATWYAVPENKARHMETLLAGRKRRLLAQKIVAELAAGPQPLAAQLASELAREALLALWYTGHVALEGEMLRRAPSPSRRYLRMPPAHLEVPAALRAVVQDPSTTALAPVPARGRMDPWSLPSPAYGLHLPGAGLVMHLSPRTSIKLEHARALHGLVTQLLDEKHRPDQPAWALIPWDEGCGWGVYLRSAAHVERLARRAFEGKVFDAAVRVEFGAPIHLRVPAPRPPGRYRLHLDAVTPVCIRHCAPGAPSKKQVHLTPTRENLLSALTQAFPARLGLDGFDPAAADLQLISRATQPERIQCGAHIGPVRGWTGSVVVEANAVAAWLLECAGRIGLGGRVAFGFGRVRVSPEAG